MRNSSPKWAKPITNRVTLAMLQRCDFWSHVEIGDPGECWFMRGHGRGGYATFHIPSRFTGVGASMTYRASRAAKSLHRGRLVPSHLVVDHLCVNPPCVNPHHLDVVTQRTNLARRVMV